MGRKKERSVKIPSFFRCPISLEVMKSPVSLCTGVTYDRASIQRWLDYGNTTCPATRQNLPSTDLVPNLTLQRLIHHWSSPSSPSAAAAAVPQLHRGNEILRELRSSAADPVQALHKLAEFFSDDENEELEKNNLVNAGGCAAVLVSILARKNDDDETGLEMSEAAIRVLALILTSDFIEKGNTKIAISALISDLNGSVSALVSVLKKGSSLESRMDAATVLESVLGLPEAKVVIAEKEEVIAELIRLIGPSDDKGTMDRRAVETGLGCLAGIAEVRRARARIARLGVVPAVTRVLAAKAEVVSAAATERAMRVMEAAAGCAEGRAAICEAAEESIGAVLGRMMKAGKEGTEAAVAVLWTVCHPYRDRRAVDAVAAANGGLTKILLSMQSACSPAARQMAADLLKIFSVNSKSCLSGYDTKTIHIMPF